MTGRDLTQLMIDLEIDPFALAAFVGVHVSSVYRWKLQRGKTLSIDGHQDLLMHAMKGYASTPHKAKLLGRVILSGLHHGPLRALRDVLVLMFEDE